MYLHDTWKIEDLEKYLPDFIKDIEKVFKSKRKLSLYSKYVLDGLKVLPEHLKEIEDLKTDRDDWEEKHDILDKEIKKILASASPEDQKTEIFKTLSKL